MKKTIKKIISLFLAFLFMFSIATENITVSAATLKTPKIISVTTTKTKLGAYQTTTIKWKKEKNISGYIIYEKRNNSEYKKVKVVKDQNSTSTSFQTDCLYAEKLSYKIRTYKVKNGKKTYSPKSKSVYTYSDPMYSQFTSIKSSGTNKIKLSWSKVPHANGYALYRKTGSEYKRIATLKSNSKTSYTVENLKKNQEYTFVVRSFITRNGKNYYSIKSAPKSAITNQKYPIIPINKKTKYYGHDVVFYTGTGEGFSKFISDFKLKDYGLGKSSDTIVAGPTEYHDASTKQPIWFVANSKNVSPSGDGSISFFVEYMGFRKFPAKTKKY